MSPAAVSSSCQPTALISAPGIMARVSTCLAAATRNNARKNPVPNALPTTKLTVRAGQPPKPQDAALMAAALEAPVTTTINPSINSVATVRRYRCGKPGQSTLGTAHSVLRVFCRE